MKATTSPRIAILGTRGIPAQYGGFETFAEELSTRLAEQGVEVTVYCMAGTKEQPLMYRKVKLAYVPSPPAGPLTTVLFDLLCLLHGRKSYDVVYMLGYGAALFCFIPRLWGTKIWINVDGIEWARAKWNFLAKTYFKIMEAIAVRIADCIIADAEGIRTFLDKRHRKMAPCIVIPYGAPLVELSGGEARLDSWGIEAHQYYLVVCRLEPENHVLDILQGFTKSKTSCPLIVIGNHQSKTDYVERLKRITDDRIRFIGTVYDKDKLLALRYYCRAYFHGHSVGGTNPSLLEALGCGNIVVTHDNVFNREVAGDAGLYFIINSDIPRLVERIEKMTGREHIETSSRAKKRIRRNYTWELVTEQYLAILKQDHNANGK